MRVRWQLDWHDVWLGVYWKRERVATGTLLTFFLCLIPCAPIVVQVVRRA